jgi:hypothetical protein
MGKPWETVLCRTLTNAVKSRNKPAKEVKNASAMGLILMEI